MTDLTRRSFLRGLLTVAAVSVAPATILHADIPRIVGDGVHDDTAGLQAALDGKPFICEGQMVQGGQYVSIAGGNYRISKTLTITRDCTRIAQCRLDGSDITEGFLIHVKAQHAYIGHGVTFVAPRDAAIL